MSKKLVVLCVSSFFLFVALWWAIHYPTVLSVDKTLLTSFRAWGWLNALSLLGSSVTIGVCSIVLVLFLLLRKRVYGMVLVLIAVAGGYGLNTWMKHVVGRERPPFSHEEGFSFPSGHAMMSSIYLLLAAYFLGQEVKQRFARFLLYGISILLALLTGISRLTRHVHYPTDVLAGFALAASYLSLCIIVYEVFQKK
ncbi:undecaprenyl-diphosphatase [Anoxybacillus voinovskiensis]|uniref:Undecaprenyl-diphosphatase n=1 Tax=Anoxybacteroides voinovskiense TaxID=230470 RepID=A0A840DI85_9BACL|nr:phosphatase PAP2 family protein [Anoxybacillus voinovskiensis]MBB4072460.1 undecaprenyl-diphosphatase [Anoxybacillus voinovskiensis]